MSNVRYEYGAVIRTVPQTKQAHCAVENKTTTFSLYSDSNYWRCQGCGNFNGQ